MKARRVAAFLALSASWSLAQAQSFPGKPIRVIVPSIAGSSPDVRVRQIAPKLSEAVGQPVIVDNRPGANGAIAAQQAAKAAPDGHTLFFALINNAVNDLLNPNSCCRLNHELAPVVHFTVTPGASSWLSRQQLLGFRRSLTALLMSAKNSVWPSGAALAACCAAMAPLAPGRLSTMTG